MIPKAVGPYVPYKQVGDIVYISGQLPLNPETTKIETDDVSEQTRQCLLNLEAVLKEVGGTLSDVVSVNVALVDINEGKAMNLEYIKFFKPPLYPARMAFGVSGLPMDAKVEISAIAHLNQQ